MDAQKTTKVYRAVHNLTLMNGGKVLQGKVMEWEATGRRWVEYSGNVEPNTDVCSGSLVELSLSLRDEKRLLRLGAIAPADADIHTDLEPIFGSEVAEHLRQSGVWTLEDVASEKPASLPLSEMQFGKDGARKPLRKLLSEYGKPQEVNEWIDAAKAAIKPKEEI